MGRLKTVPGRVAAAPTRRIHSVAETQRTRGSAWVKIRQRVLLRDRGLCVACRAQGLVTVATEVDHIVPLSEGGGDNESNLQSLCKPCHDAKSAEDGERRRGGG